MTDDMHQHRRQGDHEDAGSHRMQRIADSAVTKVVAATAVALLPILLGVIAFLGSGALNDIKHEQEVQGDAIQQIKSDVRDVNTRLDAQVIRQVDSNTKHIDKLEDRVQTLERAVRTP